MYSLSPSLFHLWLILASSSKKIHFKAGDDCHGFLFKHHYVYLFLQFDLRLCAERQSDIQSEVANANREM